MRKIATVIFVLMFSQLLSAQEFISRTNTKRSFVLAGKDAVSSIVIDTADDKLMSIAAGLLQQDIAAVTGHSPALEYSVSAPSRNIIIAGTIANSSFIKTLVLNGKIKVADLKDKWEAYHIQVVENPFNGIEKALVIVGSDKRGAAFGIFELSKQMGVSPWYWWADVPVKKSTSLYVKADSIVSDAPKVKYRGIFLNDEAPALSGWTHEKFGGFNHQFYTHVFELLLRMKANYLWPAMWGNAFNADDILNPVLADEYGIVMGTSHHEPMLRSQQEWKRFGSGAWNYHSNKDTLKSFWEKGIRNMGKHESIVTIGMRGDGDEPMTEGTAISLLENIVADQRNIIEAVTNKPAKETPQLWALYKEVQAYYDQGMRVPDDITLLLCDDNWGNIRKLPSLTEKPRKGGYGIYYHFDYVGDPRNYKWLNTNNIARVWEQMNLAWEYNARQIWLVNVGDLKPMEFPISFFLDDAWNPEAMNADSVEHYYSKWANAQFGSSNGKAIGNLIKQYTQFNARRKPELIDETTYSIEHYNEADLIVSAYNKLLEEATTLKKKIPSDYQDAYYQLLLHPIEACANLNAMYVAAAKNKWYAAQNDPLANKYADEVKLRFEKDSVISLYYNKTLAKGKWNHFMDQTHIGYTYWQQPEKQVMPQVRYVTTGASVAKDDKSTLQMIRGIAKPKKLAGVDYYEKEGVVSIDATYYSSVSSSKDIFWKSIKGIGRSGDGLTTFPVTHATADLATSHVYTTYTFQNTTTGPAEINIYCSPSLDFLNKGGLQFAVSIDDGTPIVVNLHDQFTNDAWLKAVADNIIVKKTKFDIGTAGKHTLKVWAVDPGVVFQKVMIDLGGLKASYLGPAATKF